MTKQLVWFVHATVALLTVTGVAFAWMKYFMKSDDPFAAANHPLQPWMLAAHVIIAPLAVFALGWIFPLHICPKFTARKPGRRKSGLSAMWLIVPMVLSGYFLQVVVSDGARQASAVTHWITSAIFVLGYLAHQLVRKPNGA